jgi:O-antigen/teichoic acid export membrane protein
MDNEKQKPARSATARNITWNYFGHFCQLAVNFGLTSYIVRRLSVPEYGLFLFIMFLSSTLDLLDLGISSVLVQGYIAASSSPEKNSLRELISTAFAASAVMGTVGAAILIGLSLVLPGPFNIPREYVHEASLVFIASACKVLVGFMSLAFEPLFQAANRFDRVNQIQLAGSGLTLICSVSVLYFGYGIVALATVQCVATVFQFFLSLALSRSVFPAAQINLIHFRWSTLKKLLSQSKWAFLNNASSYFVQIFVWTILGSLSSMREAALFGLATKLPNHLWYLVDRGAGVCLPLMSENAQNDNLVSLRKTYLKAQRLVLGLILPFVVLGSVFAYPLFQVWAGKVYTGSAVVMQWLLLASLAHAVLYSSDLLLYAFGQYRRAALISASGGIMSLGIAFALVPGYGAAGMAFSIAVVQVLFVCTWFTFEACKCARISFGLLASEMLRGLALPVAIMVFGICVVRALWRQISSPWLVLAGFAIGICYFAVWGFRTALPLYVQPSEGSN